MAKKPSHSRKLSVYSNLSHRLKTKKDANVRKRAQYLATLPKHPVKRLLYRMHPKRFAAYWFSKRGAIMALKVSGVAILLMLLLVGGLFAYFRKDLDVIRPGELAKRVQTTVTKYYDRNNVLLWEDKGDGNYKLVVDSAEISGYLKKATVAIEDREFYTHNGVSPSGLMRAMVNNAGGGDIQGGSTLTQQLVKQVFFADEAQNRGLSGIPRKIKELILSVEVERMYDKDQILTLYLNESPYGGRRNGVESASQTYFGKSAKDLTLPEAALLAAIPQSPSTYDPYNAAGHEALITRQHIVLKNMAEQSMITQAEADAAKKFPIIDSLKPESTQYAGIKAPHFVQMVRSQLEGELGKATVGKGGLTVTTSLDYRIQQKLEESMNDMFNSSVPNFAGFSNGAATVEDSQTGQIVALMGSRSFDYEGFGQDNAAVASIQPGSSVKSLVYAQLFQQKPAGQINYGSGSILKDENIDSIYGAKLQNADKTFKGNLSIRSSLATSRNIPAVKAMYISGVSPTLDTIHAMGGTSYCTQGTETQTGLSSAIGGCGIKQVDLVNAYATLARQGVYKPKASVLEVKNSSGEVLKKWTDESKKIVDPQSAYIVSDILTDDNARAPLSGRNAKGMFIPGVKTATKTGTSDKNGFAKDIWMVSYSPALTMGVWLGNSDTTILKRGTSSIPGPIIAKVMEYAHKEVYAPEGKWKVGDWFIQPVGIQKVGNELYPSWWSKVQGRTNTKITFDKVSKKKATTCTPESAKIELDVVKTVDPVTKKDVFIAPDGYDSTKDDDIHKCEDAKPAVSVSWVPGTAAHTYVITATVSQGTFPVSGVDIKINGTTVGSVAAPGPYTYTYTVSAGTSAAQTVTATVNDTGMYNATSSPAATTIPAYT
ncbi:transglycosylase domain-containing protein [Candidatus Saccharibacteria bacterium]|nr:transglycosylase domain-containing protein [Candidatus Saccharibacteria bacterium]